MYTYVIIITESEVSKMLQKIIENFKAKMHKRKMHKQFKEIQKWQREMYISKSREELELH